MTIAFTPFAGVGTAAWGSAGVTERVSVGSAGNQANGAWPVKSGAAAPAISADGRLVAFDSEASNLVASDTNNICDNDLDGRFVDNCPDIFVRDRQTKATTRVSLSSTGAEANGASLFPAISADGRYVAFESQASNLVPFDTNGVSDVFVHDRHTGTTTRVSVDSAGNQGNLESYHPAISADGRYVAFVSEAYVLAPGDINLAGPDIFVRDRLLGITQLVSADDRGVSEQGGSYIPEISADGRYVSFISFSRSLVEGDTNAAPDIFVRDRTAGTTERVSVSSGGAQATLGGYSPDMSADGRLVVFASEASNLVPGDSNGRTDVFVHDRDTGTTRLVSARSDGVQGNQNSFRPGISGDGRLVSFDSVSTNLVSCDTNNASDVFVRDITTGALSRESVDGSGGQANGHSFSPDLNQDGRIVVIKSYASNLVSGDTNGKGDVFVHEPTGSDSCSRKK